VVAAALSATIVFSGCSGDDGGGGDDADTTEAADATTTTVPETLDILVTNDDGIEGPGMADLVDGLQELPGAEVTIVVPADERTGSGGQTTPGGVTATEATTVNGDDALAVDGFPADSVIYALDEVYTDEPPDLVVSGINSGQNIGPVSDGSGTVSAARQAAALGVPALAVSQGLVTPLADLDKEALDYSLGVDQAVAWIEEHRDEVSADDTPAGEPTTLGATINTPSCTTGAARGPVEVPISDSTDVAATVELQDCTSTLEDPVDDIEAFNNGFITVSDLPPGLSDLQ
jgi:5'-nucleotidase